MRADPAQLLASLPEPQRRAVARFLLELVHALNTPSATLRIELYSARQELEAAAGLDDPAQELKVLAEIVDNLDNTAEKLGELIAALADAASQSADLAGT